MTESLKCYSYTENVYVFSVYQNIPLFNGIYAPLSKVEVQILDPISILFPRTVCNRSSQVSNVQCLDVSHKNLAMGNKPS